MIIDLLSSFPLITRAFLIISIVVNLLCFVGYVKPIHIFLNYRLIIEFHNYWRFLSHVFFFGQIGLKTFFYIFFFIRYSKSLELFSFRNREEDYFHLLFTGNSIIFLLKIFVPHASFLGPSVTFMIIYIWGKKNAQQLINLIDILHIKGSSLPFLLMISSYVMKQRTLKLDVIGMIAGHFCYYLEEIYPRLAGGQLPIGFFKKNRIV